MTYNLARAGLGLSDGEAAALVGISRQGAQRLLLRLSRVIPIRRVGGRWVYVDQGDPGAEGDIGDGIDDDP